ncbi:leucine-rich repeat extensin-like protein 4 [Prosopis cineraria]|uniref:leucine-rich repeat extensin-like protein 4 n=1 Tax=Prosopis cineraria TaxID=364024 RepID=UPI0024106578|nr:leucine-rich repeat extensin-like protein 4 [Prosopis cineraria]
MSMFSIYRFLMALLVIVFTLFMQCPDANAGRTMRKLAGSLPRKPPPPDGSVHRVPAFKSPPPRPPLAQFPPPPPPPQYI